MSRMIDADALKDYILRSVPNWSEDRETALDCIANSPTIEERKKGKWIPHNEKSREYIGTVLINVQYDYWLCDACGYRVENRQPIYHFCPNCGARMVE